MIDLSVVFFSHNRLGYLAQTIHDFLKHCKFPRNRMELIICDDGSDPKYHTTLQDIKNLFGVDNLLLLPNGGMGKSFNIGLKIAQGKYILHLQDDWSLMHDDGFIETSIKILDADPNVAMIRLAMLGNEFTCFGGKITKIHLCDIAVSELSDDFYIYSDNPHIKTKRFHEEFGYYLESKICEDVEKDMCRKFNQQNRWKIIWLNEYFKHIGQFSTMKRVWPSAPKIPMHFRPDQFKDM